MRATPLLIATLGLATPAAAEFSVCSELDQTAYVAVGYQAERGWTSEGWWAVEPGACATVIAAPLTTRYLYYRAEAEGLGFDDASYVFCTTPEAFTIVGDENCEDRGFERAGFREIDVGQGTTAYTLTLSAGGTPPPEPLGETPGEPEEAPPEPAPEPRVEPPAPTPEPAPLDETPEPEPRDETPEPAPQDETPPPPAPDSPLGLSPESGPAPLEEHAEPGPEPLDETPGPDPTPLEETPDPEPTPPDPAPEPEPTPPAPEPPAPAPPGSDNPRSNQTRL